MSAMQERGDMDKSEWLNSLMAFGLSQEDALSIIEDIKSFAAEREAKGRREAVEDCCNIECGHCDTGHEVILNGNGKWVHPFADHTSVKCEADHLRRLTCLPSPATEKCDHDYSGRGQGGFVTCSKCGDQNP